MMKLEFSNISMRSSLMLIIFVVGVLTLSMVESSPQHFYPSGRYGRRDSMPELNEIASGREMTVAFFGDGSVRCVYTGFKDYYRCARKVDSRPISSPLDD